MKTALLHYWLTNMRGGEKVLAALAEMFPDADVYTHAYNPARVSCLKSHRVHESFIAQLPFGRKWTQAYLPLMPLANAVRCDRGIRGTLVGESYGCRKRQAFWSF